MITISLNQILQVQIYVLKSNQTNLRNNLLYI